jgi:4-hydroxyproline epimerase
MCGHGTIGTITIAIEEGLIIPKVPGKIRMEAPAGLVEIEYKQVHKKVEWVKLTNVKSYLAASDLSVECPELGILKFDVAYGGNYYAIIDPQPNFVGIQNYTANQLIQYSQVIRQRINEKYPHLFIHPENETIRDVTHVQWTGATINPKASGRNAVFYGDKAIDRSPCGTGTSARMAQLHAKGLLKAGEDFIHESYIGSQFIGRVAAITNIGEIPAIVPSIQGWAKVYGYNTIIIDDEDDPYAHGFQVL